MTNTTISIFISAIISVGFTYALSRLVTDDNLVALFMFTWPFWIALGFYLSFRYVCPKILSSMHYKSFKETYEVANIDCAMGTKDIDIIKEFEISKWTKLKDYLWLFFVTISFPAVIIAGVILITTASIKSDKPPTLIVFNLAMYLPVFLAGVWAMYKALTSYWRRFPSYRVVFECSKLKVYRHSKSGDISISDIETVEAKYLNDIVVSIRLNLSERGGVFKKNITIKGYENRKNFMKCFLDGSWERVSIW